MSDLQHAHLEPDERQRANTYLKALLVVVISIVIGYVIVGFVGAIDWALVVEAVGRLWTGQYRGLLASPSGQ